jgi:hypothetical protein
MKKTIWRTAGVSRLVETNGRRKPAGGDLTSQLTLAVRLQVRAFFHPSSFLLHPFCQGGGFASLY